MKGQWKGFISGLAVATLVFGLGAPALAATVRQLNATYSGIKITLDGNEVVPKDANGAAVEPFVVDGTTYLPVRAVANALGIGVEWDGATQTVKLTSGAATTQETPKPAPATGSNVPGNGSDEAGQLIQAGDVFVKGSYILLDGVKIAYDGESFPITNNSTDIVRVSVRIVGVKSDGTFETLQLPSFGGTDESKYAKDLKENGWAVKDHTNMIRPGETLLATLSVFDFSAFGEDYPNPDIDGDGYYDIIFTISPQPNEDTIRVSSDDTVSGVYKLAVK